MKRWKLSVCVIMILVLLTACGEKTLQVSTNTLYIKKDGKLEEAAFELFDKEYYNAEELKSFAGEEAYNYNYKNVREAVTVDRVEMSDNVAGAYLTYETVEDYIAFNEVDMYLGTVKGAMNENYGFDVKFVSYDKLEEADVMEVTKDSGNKVLIFDSSIDVRIDGTICFVSDNVQKKDKKNVTLTQGSLSYIIYK